MMGGDGRQPREGRQTVSQPTCPECGRTFNLTDPADAADWYYGHDCETET